MMPGYWILKTEPSTYSHADLVKDGTTVWDGVKNPVALRNLAAMKRGDEVLIYHTGSEKAAVGKAVVAGEARPDPKKKDPRLLVVTLEADRPLARPVTLAEIKADAAFAGSPLVRVPRLSVIPVSAAQWRRLLALAGR
jgi:predicted RNA-binding protein with PUA-like domain